METIKTIDLIVNAVEDSIPKNSFPGISFFVYLCIKLIGHYRVITLVPKDVSRSLRWPKFSDVLKHSFIIIFLGENS